MTKLDARIKALELNAPQVRDVILCIPCKKEYLLANKIKLAEGIFQHAYSSDSINYTSTELLNDYLKTMPEKQRMIYQVVTVEEQEAIINKLSENI